MALDLGILSFWISFDVHIVGFKPFWYSIIGNKFGIFFQKYGDFFIC